VDSDVDLDDIVLSKNSLVARVGAVVGSNIIEVQAGGEAHSGKKGIALGQAIVSDEPTDAVLDVVGDFNEGLARFDVFLGPLADLTMGLGRLAIIRQKIAVDVVEMTLLFVGGTEAILINIFDFFPLGVVVVGEKFGNGDRRRVGLGSGSLLLLGLLLVLLLLLGAAFAASYGSSGGFDDDMSICVVVGVFARVLGSTGFGSTVTVGGAVGFAG